MRLLQIFDFSRTCFFVIFACAFFVGGAAASYAQDRNSNLQYLSKDEQKAAQSPQLKEILEQAVWPSDADLEPVLAKGAENMGRGRSCSAPEVQSIGDLKLAFMDPGLGQLITAKKYQAIWLVNADVLLCDEVMDYRYVVVQNLDGSYDALINTTGHTYAWPTLIKDAMFGVLGRLIGEVQGSDCELTPGNFAIQKMSVASEENLGPDIFGVRFSGVWHEVWTVRACDKMHEIPVKFTADGVGGAYYEVPPAGKNK